MYGPRVQSPPPQNQSKLNTTMAVKCDRKRSQDNLLYHSRCTCSDANGDVRSIAMKDATRVMVVGPRDCVALQTVKGEMKERDFWFGPRKESK